MPVVLEHLSGRREILSALLLHVNGGGFRRTPGVNAPSFYLCLLWQKQIVNLDGFCGTLIKGVGSCFELLIPLLFRKLSKGNHAVSPVVRHHYKEVLGLFLLYSRPRSTLQKDGKNYKVTTYRFFSLYSYSQNNNSVMLPIAIQSNHQLLALLYLKSIR